MSEAANFHLLFTQLQSRYPACSLISELLRVHRDRFIVRASVQSGGVTLATGMATAATIEQAEDEARLRVLSLLGITAIASSAPVTLPPPVFPASISLPPLPTENGSVPSVAPLPLEEINSTPSFQPSIAPEPLLEAPPSTKPLIKKKEPVLAQETDFVPVIEDLPAIGGTDFSSNTDDFLSSDLNGISTGVPTDEELEYPPELDDPGEPVDLSELIALTDVEMGRTGWSKKRGQSYLKRTYGKQTRAELNEDQLMEFLHYLRALPSQQEDE